MLAVLGLTPGATLAEIKQARTDLVKVWHPDRFSHDARLKVKAEEKLKEINAAYEWLCSHPDSLRFDPKTSARDTGESLRRTASDPRRPTRPRRSGKPPYSHPRRMHPSRKPGLSNLTQLNLMRAGLLILGIGWLGLMVSVMGYVGLAVGPLIAYGVYRIVRVFS
jgi:curved DNA-binding protein CbpA